MATQPDSNPKTTQGRLKPPVHAIPPSAIIALGLAMENGEGKYGLMNWRQSAVSSSVYYDAALRHLLAWWDGENVAQDSNVHHLAHVMACCAILIDAEIGNKLLDDRPVAGPAAEMIGHLHDQRIAAAVQSVMPIAQVADPQSLAAAVDEANVARNNTDMSVVWYDDNSPFWNRIFNKRKEPTMATELETIIASVHRSEASSEKTRALVMTLGQKLDDMRQSTTDPTTRAQLLSLSAELDNETDAVDKTEAAGEAAAADPAPVAGPTPAAPPVTTDPAAPADPNVPADPAPPAMTEDPAPVADPTAPTT